MAKKRNRKIKINKEKKNKTIFLLVFIAFLFLGFVKALGSSKIDFLWIGNNSYSSGDKAEASLGMIKVGGSNFGITIQNEKNSSQLLDGSAWMGIGSTNDKVGEFSSQNDHPSLGWIRFNQNFPNFCGEGKSCQPVTWKRKSGVAANSLEGYLSGWAKFELGKNGDGAEYPETWVYFKAPLNEAEFSCDSRANLNRTKDYYACTDKAGYLFGYGWSSEAAASTIEDNSGFGWINIPGISFNNCEENGVCNLNCSHDRDCCRESDYTKSHPECNNICEKDNMCNQNCTYDSDCCDDSNYAKAHSQCVYPIGSCNLYRIDPAGTAKIKTGSTVKYKVSIDGGKEPKEIFYKCVQSGQEKSLVGNREAEYTCSEYSSENTEYISSTRYSYEDSNGETKYAKCGNTVTVTTEGVSPDAAKDCKCKVLVKKANTTGIEENRPVNSLGLENISEEVEAAVDLMGDNCSQEKPLFSISDSSKMEYNANGVKFYLKDNIPQSVIAATVNNKDNQKVDCDKAEVYVKEKMGWR